jgi:hypothetical protein
MFLLWFLLFFDHGLRLETSQLALLDGVLHGP